jgi:hypothetical protein
MEDITRDLLVSIAAFAAIFGIIYVFLMTRYKERMSMLEKGLDSTVFASPSGSSTLKFGMLFIGVSLGILSGYALHTYAGLEETVAFLSMVFLFGGTSLIINYLIEKGISK